MREYRSHRSDETRSRHDPVHHTFSSTARQPRGLQPLRCRARRLASLNLAPHAAQSTQHPMYGTCTACGCHGQDPEHMRDMARVQTTQSSSTRHACITWGYFPPKSAIRPRYAFPPFLRREIGFHRASLERTKSRLRSSPARTRRRASPERKSLTHVPVGPSRVSIPAGPSVGLLEVLHRSRYA